MCAGIVRERTGSVLPPCDRSADRPRVSVLAPSTLVTVTIEDGGAFPEVHFHAGGQGFWVARMAGALGADVAFATALGGESGAVLDVLLESEPIAVHAIRCAADNGVYVHDRRGGERSVLARVPAPRLRRHEADELYGVALADGLESHVACLTGPEHAGVLNPRVYARIAADLRSNRVMTLADLTGPALRAVLDGGVDLLKLNDTELVDERWALDDSPAGLTEALLRLRRAGAAVVIASRGPKPLLALIEDELYEFRGPDLLAADPAGTGDSMFAAIAVALAAGRDAIGAITLGVAAGAVNATRHGLGSGTRHQIGRLAHHVTVERIDDALAGARETG